MWSVRILSGQQSGQIFDLKLGKNVFGRGGVSDFKVQSLGISKEHCELHVYKDKMMIVDLKSSNGTFVNGVKIQNSIVRVGDKISLFDVIMDVILTPDIRPKKSASPKEPRVQNPPAVIAHSMSPPPVPAQPQYPVYPQQGGAALQMGVGYQPNPYGLAEAPPVQQAPEPALSLQQKIENYIENVLMPSVYKLAVIFSFKQVLQAFVLIFIFAVTALSSIPLTNVIKESNFNEAAKRARSVARAMAKMNEQALLSGQLSNLSVQEALKEEGIKEALIVQQSDGMVIAPPEKAGRENANPIILKAREESRATFGRISEDTLGASFPVAVYDPSTGEATPKYHAVVTYNVSSLNVDQNKVVSLFMQTLMMATVLGLILYQLFARLIEFPLRSLNTQIEKALIEKTDRTEVVFDYPTFQQLVSNVNTVLNRAWSGAETQSQKPQQNKDLEFANLVEIISHPAIVLDTAQRVVAINSNFEQLAQTTRDAVVNQSYQTLTDSALVQNIDSLVARALQSPYERQMDRIPFAQYECEIFCQAFLNVDGEAQYFVLTLTQVNT